MLFRSHLLSKIDALLNRRRVTQYPALCLLVSVIFYGFMVAFGDPPFDIFGKPILVDYSAHATGGLIARSGDIDRLYEPAYQIELQQRLLGVTELHTLDLYLSPPFVAWLYAPISGLPYMVQAASWLTLTVTVFLLALRLLWPLVPRLHGYRFVPVALVSLSCVAATEMLFAGQDSALSLLLLVVGLRLLLARQDVLAGAVLALGLYKPQLFALVPVLLLCQRRWRALFGWIVVALVLAAGSVATVGLAGLRDYAHLLTSDVYRRDISEGLDWKMLSIPALVRDLPLGSAIIATAALLLFAAFYRIALIKQNTAQGFALLYGVMVLATALFNPHFFLYDGVILLISALLLLNAKPESPGLRVMILAVYLLMFTAPIGVMGVPGLAPANWVVLPVVGLLWIARGMLLNMIPNASKQEATFQQSHPTRRHLEIG